jgi:hypothetical protein
VSFDYQFGGLAIRAQIALEGLRPIARDWQGGPELRVTAEQGPPPTGDFHHFSWPGRYGLRLGEHDGRWLFTSAVDGAFLLARDGSAMHIVVPQLPPKRATIDVLERRVLPRVPILLGATAIHAAALAGDGGALMLLGDSGAGKSTLTAALAHLAGWGILSDDMSLLWDESGAPLVAPAAAGVCVWPRSRDGLGLLPERCTKLPGYEGKMRFVPDAEGPVRAAALKGLIFLDRRREGVAPSLDRLARTDAMTLALPQIIHFNPHGSSGAERVAAVTRLNRTLQTVPAWRLTYPGSFAELPAVVQVLRTLI